MLETCLIYPAAVGKGAREQDDAFLFSAYKYVKIIGFLVGMTFYLLYYIFIITSKTFCELNCELYEISIVFLVLFLTR